MIVISDTSPLTSLISIDHEDILKQLYKDVVIPQAVYRELLEEHINLPDFIIVKNVRDREHVESLIKKVDIGEAEAIVLAKERKADFLLIDEQIGRRVAESEGIRIIRLMGILLIAKGKGYINSVRKTVSLLEEKAGFWLSDSLKQYIFEKAKE